MHRFYEFPTLRSMLIQAVEADREGDPTGLDYMAGALGSLLNAHESGKNAAICVHETITYFERSQRKSAASPASEDPEEPTTDHGREATTEPPEAA